MLHLVSSRFAILVCFATVVCKYWFSHSYTHRRKERNAQPRAHTHIQYCHFTTMWVSLSLSETVCQSHPTWKCQSNGHQSKTTKTITANYAEVIERKRNIYAHSHTYTPFTHPSGNECGCWFLTLTFFAIHWWTDKVKCGMFVSCTLNHQIENVDSVPSQIKLNGSHFIDNTSAKKNTRTHRVETDLCSPHKIH